MSHKKIMKKCAHELEEDAMHYKKKIKTAKSSKKKHHERIEEHEAESAAKELKKRAKHAHE